jgi:hypothetical protein
MKRQEHRLIKITFEDAGDKMSPAEYSILKSKRDRFWDKLIAEARQQIAEDNKRGIEFKSIPKSTLADHCFEMADQLDIKLPRSFRRLFYDDIYLIHWQLEYELKLRNWEKEGCEVVFEPPRLPSSEIIARMIERAKVHKAKGLRFFADLVKSMSAI